MCLHPLCHSDTLSVAGQAGLDDRAGAADRDLQRRGHRARGGRGPPTIAHRPPASRPLSPPPPLASAGAQAKARHKHRLSSALMAPIASDWTKWPQSPRIAQAKGRHDPCVLPRTPPLIEGMAALVRQSTATTHTPPPAPFATPSWKRRPAQIRCANGSSRAAAL